jgi:hypothetical protein
MMYVDYRDGSVLPCRVGNTIINPREVLEIQADGDELERIHEWGYPDHGTRVQTYIGDTARQICINWK